MAGTSSEVVIGGRRESKKQCTNSRSNKQVIQDSSSTNDVESMDDLLIQIFLRVPVLSLLMFKLVSKRWFNIITSRFFIQRRSQVPNHDPPCALIFQRRTKSLEYNFAAFDTRIERNKILNKDSLPFGSYPDKRDIKILQCCNGLLLCYINRYMLYVYNPFRNQFKMLPQSTCTRPIACINGIKMLFDPTKSPHYKVIFASVLKEDILIEIDDIVAYAFVQIRTYSSETCDWSISPRKLPLRSYYGFRNGVYWNDAIYWLNMNTGSVSKLDVVNINITSIPAPIDLREGDSRFMQDLFESRGSLLFSCLCRAPGEFLMVYEMKNGNSEWTMKYFINVYYIIGLIPAHWMHDDYAKPICVRCIVLGEREEDSYLVVDLYGKVAQYKMMSKTLHEISDVGETHNCICMEDRRLRCFPFVPSFAAV